MKAQVFRGVNQLSYEEVPVPELEADEVLVQVRVVGLCQSDIKKICYPEVRINMFCVAFFEVFSSD